MSEGPVLDPRIFDGMVTAAALFAGPENRLVYANDVFTRLFGDRRIGLPARRAFPDADAHRFLGVLDTVRSTGQSRQVIGERRTDPDAVAQAQHFVYACNSVPTRQGPGILVLAMDTTAESSTLRRYAALIDAVTQMVWVVHNDRTVEEVVPGWESITGAPWPGRAGEPMDPYIHPRDRDHLKALWNGPAEQDDSGVVQTDYRLRAADGSYRHVSARAVPVVRDEPDADWVVATSDVEDTWGKRLRERLLAGVAEASGASLPAAFAEVVRVIVPELADCCLILLLSHDEWPLPDRAEATARRVASAVRPGLPPPPALRGQRLPATGVVREVLERGVPRTFRIPPDGPVPPGLVPAVTERWLIAAGATSMSLIPLAVDDRVLGYAVTATTGDTPVPTPREIDLLREVLHHAQRPIRKVLDLQQARRTAIGLQRAQLTDPPSVPGLDLAARYQPAGSNGEIGGDWYDAFTLPDGTLVLDIGDVAGHDLAAATAMVQMRSMLRALAYVAGQDVTPAAVLQRLDDVADGLHAAPLATAIHATVRRTDDGAWQLTWSNAGHPPPLVIPAHGEARFLTAPADPPLCVLPSLQRTTHTHVLRPGDTLLLHTDGLIETPTTSLDFGQDQLLARATLHRRETLPDLLCAIETMADRRDDVAMLALRIEPTDS
ncbi:SpoIIE family protein phosphatase [Streptomyces sp. NPDC050418]|uniref:SpoIIE family protein phosphatase n=1 Tax=Streptomyces sp. NPDC050418 TaxID=3365612 RepID=UPI00379FDC2F